MNTEQYNSNVIFVGTRFRCIDARKLVIWMHIQFPRMVIDVNQINSTRKFQLNSHTFAKCDTKFSILNGTQPVFIQPIFRHFHRLFDTSMLFYRIVLSCMPLPFPHFHFIIRCWSFAKRAHWKSNANFQWINNMLNVGEQ